MKQAMILVILLCSIAAQAQIKIDDPIKKTERAVENRGNTRVDQGIEKGLDKVEEGIINIFKKKKRKQTGDKETAGSNNTATSNNTIADTSMPNEKNLKVNSKFDFVPGEKVLFIEDFSQDNLGDFPAKWNTNGSGELVNIEGQANKFLRLNKDNVVFPEFVKNLPENFTLEFDLYCTDKFNFYNGGLDFGITTTASIAKDWKTFQEFGNKQQNTKHTVQFYVHPTAAGGNHGTTGVWSGGSGAETLKNYDVEQNQFQTKTGNTFVHVSIWRQKTRVRVYLNDAKAWDLPRVIPEGKAFQSVYFYTRGYEGRDESYFIGNVKLAIGDPDTRNKLITQGKYVTSGILFDVNSAKVKAESYGVIKEIASILTENEEVRVKIIGHTDSDGDNNSNLELSKKRAEAVKSVLTQNFNIKPDRLTTDGKGETEPIDKSSTAEAKANNRRVEFVKQ